MFWEPKQARASVANHLGFIPMFVSEDDPRHAREQFDAGYAHGGGWNPFGQGKWKMLASGNLLYPEDPPTELLFEAKLRDETIRVYDYGFVAIVQPDGSFEVSRMD